MTAPAPSFQDLYDLALSELVARNPDLQVLEGDITDAMLCGAAAAGDADIRQSARDFGDLFLDTAEGDALAKLVDDRYQLQKHVAAAAIGSVTIARSSGGAAETLIAGSRVATATDVAGGRVIFTLDAPAVFATGANGPVSVAVTATTTGRGGNVAIGAIAEFVDRPTDSTFTVTNAAITAGGAEVESDPALRQRARSFYATLRRGTLDAIEAGALTVPQVRTATASESPTGLVSLYVADADGNSNAEMLNLVVIALEAWRAGGTVVQVLGGAIFLQDLTLSITARPGVVVDLTIATAAAVGALARLVAGETFYLDAVRSAVKAIDPEGIKEVVVLSPTANVAPAPNQLLRAGAVTFV